MNSGDFKLSAKASPAISVKLPVLLLSSVIFSGFDWLLKSLFLDAFSKEFGSIFGQWHDDKFV